MVTLYMEQGEDNSEQFDERAFLDGLDNNEDSSMPMNDFGMGGQMPTEQNLVEWQLDFKPELNEIKMFLSGFEEGYDARGNWTYLPPTNTDEAPFNSHGVNTIMRHIKSFLNRNTVLSNHDPKRIKKICFDFGNILADEIMMTYEKLGMDTPMKQRKYTGIVSHIIIMVESALNRAIRGGERESLRTARQVNQSEPLGGHYGVNSQPRGRKFKLNKPGTWI